MPEPSFFLGPFELTAPIGKGAMGEVWRGVHVKQQVPVAVKVVTAQHARDEKTRQAFHNEVRAVARLHHPGIVLVLDYGQVTPEAERQAQGRIVAGSPYLAMELATGGTLPRPKTPQPWPRIRALLLELLDALAHAHARGVVHRDIKPGNILVASSADGRPGLKLTDFGIARALGIADESGGLVSGTPQYMAPEQILDQVRDQGPWTDLYSLGCLAYQLATGRRMFPGARGTELLRHQVHSMPTPVRALHLPEGFQDWLSRMLAKKPSDRFQLAADAAWGLACLGQPKRESPVLSQLDTNTEGHDDDGLEESADSSALSLQSEIVNALAFRTAAVLGHFDLSSELFNDNFGDTLRMEAAEVVRSIDQSDEPRSELGTLAEIFRSTRATRNPEDRICHCPPCPQSWRRSESLGTLGRLMGAGLGLWGLRSIPLINRDGERDLIWQNLLAVKEQASARFILLQGAPGYGKSRLVQWMCQRAYELGAARFVHATHSPIPGQADGLGAMIAAEVGALGVSRAEALERAQDFIESHPLARQHEEDALALVEVMVGPEPSPDAPRLHFASLAERYQVISTFFRRLCQDRPCILWLDDAQWAADSLACIDHILAQQSHTPIPLLVLATVRDDELDNRRIEARAVNDIRQQPCALSLQIGPLAPEDHRTLVEHLLGLEGALTDQVAERTSGNPLFAIQLVGDWVQRGILTVGEHGFVLKPGASSHLPDDIHQLWIARLEQLFANQPFETIWTTLEIAAVLGRDFHPAEWEIACGMQGLAFSHGTIETMLAHRLFEPNAVWLSFTHGMLRECLERTASDAKRLRHHHLACARMLEHCYPGQPSHIAERRGEHLVQAGEVSAALEPLLVGANARVKLGDYPAAHALFERREAAMAAVISPDRADPRWGLGWVRRARAFILQGRLSDAESLIVRALEQGEHHRFTLVSALALRELGLLRFDQGETQAALEAYQQSLPHFGQVDAKLDEAESFLGMGKAYYFRHELEAAERCLRTAIDLQQRYEDSYGLGKSLKILANVYQRRGAHDDAVSYLEQALGTFQQQGYRWDVAACLNDLGESWRAHGRLEEAEWYYRASADGYLALNSTDVATPRFNLSLLLIARERFAEAKTVLEEERIRLEPLGKSMDIIWIYAGLLPCCAATYDWPAFQTYLNLLQQKLRESGVVEPDIPHCAERAGRIAAEIGATSHAYSAFLIAAQQYQALEQPEALNRVQQWMQAIDQHHL